MRQGDKGECAYIIEEGQVEILIKSPGGVTQSVGTRGAGALIGEMAIVDDAPRVATVKALLDCKMLEITRDDYAQRLKTSDPVIQMITQVILTRYRDTLTRSDILRESLTYPPPEALERNFTAQTDIVESVKIGNEFKEALENNALELYYQPIVDLKSGKVSGFEALMRWTHPVHGFISPGVFIPIIEKNGMIVEASKWALREACSALKRIESQVKSDKPLYMSVNFSSHDFTQENFVTNVLETIKTTKVNPQQIKLEITERLLIQEPDCAKAALTACKDAGIGIFIDDFGTGYSSLSYLYYFPIDTLKIDQSFIRAMQREDRSRELVKSIIGLGKSLNLCIVAEGVETLEEAVILRDMGCDTVQGFYLARPLPEKDVIQTLNHWDGQKKLSA